MFDLVGFVQTFVLAAWVWWGIFSRQDEIGDSSLEDQLSYDMSWIGSLGFMSWIYIAWFVSFFLFTLVDLVWKVGFDTFDFVGLVQYERLGKSGKAIGCYPKLQLKMWWCGRVGGGGGDNFVQA